MEEEISRIGKTAFQALFKAVNLDELEKIRIEYLGRKGVLSKILHQIKDLPQKDKVKIGSQANSLKKELQKKFIEKNSSLEKTEHDSILEKEWIDTSRPGIKTPNGHLHPVTIVIKEVEEIFTAMGFAVVEGPEVESEYYNFDALNIPANHSAREMWDTFWLKQKLPQSAKNRLLLRTHTSPVQIRYMEKHILPIRIIAPGRAYRFEATDASHDFQFNQVEGLMIDHGVSIANFKAVMHEFFRRFFSKKTSIRLRPSYFPFTEPSFEIDVSCINCSGKGCSVCKKTGWVEIAGAGIVHPKVLESAGYVPKEASGFAFGIGMERITMMKYKIPDIRLFNSGDLRFLRQF